MAVCEKNLTGVQFLLGKLKDSESAKQAISKQDSSGRNLLHLAAAYGAVDIFQMLMLTLGPKQSREMLSTETTSDGNTILHLVRDASLVKLVQLAVTSQVCNDLMRNKNKLERTPLHTAAMLDASLVFKDLLKCSGMNSKQAEFQLTGSEDRNGRTPLHIALQHGHLQVFKDMVESVENAAGCFQVADGNGDTILRQYVMNSDHEWESKLKYVLDKVGAEQLRILLKQTTNIRKNETLLHVAAAQSGNQFRDLLNVCDIKSAEEIKGIMGGGPGHEQRALHVACELGNEFLVRLLLECGCKVDIMKHDELFLGNTALHAAAIGSNKRVFKLLLDSLGSSVDMNQCVNWFGQTPLHFAMASGFRGRPLAKYLMKKRGANPAQSDHAGATYASTLEAFEGRLNLLSTVTDAGMTPLHYQACSAGVSEDDAWKEEWFVNSLEMVDTVEHLTPFLWSAKAIDSNPFSIFHANKNPLNGFSGALLLSNQRGDGFSKDTMKLMCGRMIQRERDEVVITSVFVACTLVYGDEWTNRELAKKLLEHSNDSSKLADLLAKSRGLQLAAMCAADSDRKTTLSAFLEVVTQGDKHGSDILSKLQVELESAFLVALVNNAEDGILQVLVKYMPPFRVRELLQTWLCKVIGSYANFERNYQSLSSREKSKMMDIHKMVEDVPLAYWITFAQLKQQESRGHDSDSQEKLNSRKLEADTLSLVMRMVHGSDNNEPVSEAWGVDTEYPNSVGRYTRRTALHWAIIFGEKDIVTRLTTDKRCKKDLVDDFGKPAYWYALLHKEKLKFELDKQTYMTFIDLLKWDKYYDSLYKDRDMYVEGLNAILVGAALIAAVAFTGLVTPPLQYPVTSSQSTPDVKYVAVYMPEVQVFWVANSMSFFLSITSSLACVTGILPNPSAFDLLEVERIRKVVERAATFLVLSILFILVAFVSAGFSVLPRTVNLQANFIVTTVVGGALCVFRLYRFGNVIYSLNPSNKLQRVIWWLKSNIKLPSSAQPKAGSTSTGAVEAEATWADFTSTGHEAEPERRTYKRGSIHEHIVNSGGFSNGPYVWDDGLWDPPFAEKKKPAEAVETSLPDLAILVEEAGPSSVV